MEKIEYFQLMKVLEKQTNLELDEIETSVSLLDIFVKEGICEILPLSWQVDLTEKGLNSTMNDITNILLRYDVEVV